MSHGGVVQHSRAQGDMKRATLGERHKTENVASRLCLMSDKRLKKENLFQLQFSL